MTRTTTLMLSFLALTFACATATTPADQQRGSRWSAYPTVPVNVALAQDTSAKNSDKYVCTMETEVGSHIPERICRPVNAESELAAQRKREESQKAILDHQLYQAIRGN